MHSFLDKLNPMQRQAVTTTEGPLLILAGAGSGKTTVLVNRVAYIMLERHVMPYQILAITFTNKAAGEMKKRIEALFGEGARDMWVSTFHSMCVKILRRSIEELGYDKDFVIYDTTDTQTVIKDCMKELNLNDKSFTPRMLLSCISKAKDELMDADTYEKLHSSDFRLHSVAKVYKLYQKKLKANNALDFDDLICTTVKLFQNCPHVLERYQNQFHYIMVDEYQDTNNAQYQLIALLADKRRNLCVVGDDDQSIYKFRGANIRNILDFEKDFADANVIKLEQNYRSTSTILNAANKVIENNKGRKGKNLWTDKNEGDQIVVYRAKNEHDEGYYIANEIDRLVRTGDFRYSDFIVLYRTNAQSRVLEEMMLKNTVPYRVLSGLRFYDRKEIKDLVAYLRLILNKGDSVSLKRIVNEPKRSIGPTTMNRAELIANEREISLFDVLSHAEEYEDLKRSAVKLIGFTRLIEELTQLQTKYSLREFVEKVLELTGYTLPMVMENTVESQGRLENLSEFMSVVAEYEKSAENPNLAGFLESVSLVSDIDNYDADQDAVVLMTIHSAKGLEFPVVFLAGLEEGLFPGMRSIGNAEEIEEERRLCYVAITRAENRLYITNTFQRMIYGQTTYPMPSRFLCEIPGELIDEIGEKQSILQKVAANTNTTITQKPHQAFDKMTKSSLFEVFDVRKSATELPDFAEGDVVMHKKFGKGKILSAQPLGNDVKLQVAFDNGETKQLMAMFAKLQKINDN